MNMEAMKRALEIANSNKVGMLGTVDENGNPYIKAMLYIKHDGLREFWFCSNTSSKRAKHITKNPNTCLYFYEGDCNERYY
ncbi:general stress protein 26 [Aequitasia blattaphilus]|uniref:Pyridoxamine 5'-phosphate oxidase family protein n=2 Tax=Aequitasia blattaphilus TaxID=2949332 RepID=A0ABT1EBH9_9FIRM|nr:pyridoxamine 5'-phosphate oxidase family protein [Aequitasia blattaphilus]MCR8615829.1 pyridoxamine 5'-phosphate oxidase family protein [Aequitasia blattaphilus]